MDKLKTLLETLQKARTDLAQVFDQAEGGDFKKVTCISGTDEEKCATVRKMSADAEAIQKEVDSLRDLEHIKGQNAKAQEDALRAGRPMHPAAGPEKKSGEPRLSIGEMFTKMGCHLPANRHKDFLIADVGAEELKTIMDRATTGGLAPESTRTGRVVPYAVRPPNFLDILPTRPTSQAAVVYMEETVLTESNVIEKAEAADAGEAAITYAQRSVTVQKIPVWIPVTDEQLEDVPYIESLINQRLGEMLIRRVSHQGINGTGVSPLLVGLNATGVPTMQTTAAVAGDGNADTIARAIKDVRVTGRSVPSGIVLNTTDWLNERLRKTKDGAYIWGSPAVEGMGSMWGLPIVIEDSITAGLALVGDFRMFGAWVEKRGIQVKVSDSHAAYFIAGTQVIRADMRGAFVWERPTAFSLVTLP